jgi:hypothetical protein
MQHSMQQKDVDKEKEINVCCINNVAKGVRSYSHKEGTAR